MLLNNLKRLLCSRFGTFFVAVLVSCWLVGMVCPATAQATQVITWDDLQPKQTVDFAATFGHLSREQLQDLATLARIRWWLADNQITPDSPDAALGARLEQKLTQQGLDVESLIHAVHQVEAQTNDTSDAVGKRVKISGYALPLKRTDQQQVSQLLLVPFVGACIHVPPPPPNQVIYVEPSVPIDDPGLFTPVWVEGQLHQQSATYDLFRVDGSRPIQVSYAISLQSITIDSSRSRARQSFRQSLASMPHLSTQYSGQYSWWQAIQVESTALFGQMMGDIRADHSPSALLLGVLIAFGYGVVHTLGPGHGKVVILSYFVGNGGSVRRGISMGVRIAVLHVISAIAVVLLTDIVIRQTVGSAPASYRLIRLISYAAIALIGGWMLRQALRSKQLSKQQLSSHHFVQAELPTVTQFSDRILQPIQLLPSNRSQLDYCRCFSCDRRPGTAGWLSLAVGAVPCSGALLIMLYGLANDLVWPAMLMVLAISLGMGVTLSAIGLTALWGRAYLSRRMDRAAQWRYPLFQLLNIVGAGGILLVGLLLFLSTLSGGRLLPS
ncbi:MAG: HoxN/HupN/NixA family nickel/cobalt transporter [Thainema sp.]